MDNKYLNIYQYVTNKLSSDNSGHDINHINRVVNHGLKLLKLYPNADEEVVIIACLVHDVIDRKVVDNQEIAIKELRNFLASENITKIDQIFDIILNMSYSQHKLNYFANNLEGMIVQDSDRLDALGAIGIIRTISYGNQHNRGYDDTIKHFDEKLFLLPDLMNLEHAKKLASEMVAVMEVFYQAYQQENTSLEDILNL